MRILAITRGIPGSGKSTWIKTNNLSQYCLSPDDLRLIFGGTQPRVDGTDGINQQTDRVVWSTLMTALEGRMARGQFTIVDATNTQQSDIAVYEKLAKKYRYRLVIIDFSNVPTAECKTRNATRDPAYKTVPVEVIDKFATRLLTPLPTKYQQLLCTPEAFVDTYKKPYRYDLNKYNKVVVFGDIHGCMHPLNEFFATQPFSEETFYVFTGDYIDRGLESSEVIQFLASIKDKSNVKMLIGNHEHHIERLMRTNNDMGTIKNIPETTKTIQALDIDTFSKLREVVRKCAIAFCFSYDGKDYDVTHAGLPSALDNFRYSATECIKGVGDYSDITKIDDVFDDVVTSIHGHRNVNGMAPFTTNGNAYNLCDTIEYGGNLRVLIIEKGNVDTLSIKNTYFKNKYNTVFNVDEVDNLNRLAENKTIVIKDQGNGISSYNFSRDVFTKDMFDSCTIKARGLFIANQDSECCGKIIARSYDKFFNVYLTNDWRKDDPDNDLQDKHLWSIKDNIQFPVTVYKKENGFLGLLSWDPINNDFFATSKSQSEGEHAGYFKSILKPHLTDELKKYLQENDVTMIFEVVDGINDGGHPIDYNDKQELYLLDVMHNTFDNEKLIFDDIVKAGNKFGFNPKTQVTIIYDFAALESFMQQYEQPSTLSLHHNQEMKIEGFVFEEVDGKMFKYKTKFYRDWKQARSVLSRVQSKQSVKTNSSNPMLNTIAQYMLDNRERITSETTIIEVQRWAATDNLTNK